MLTFVVVKRHINHGGRKMKTPFILFVVLISLTACSETKVVDSSKTQGSIRRVIDSSKIQRSIRRVIDSSKIQRSISNGIVYCMHEGQPFTGIVMDRYENGQKKGEANLKDGKQDGKMIAWFETGQKKREWNFKDGKLDGKVTKWNANGQIESEENYKDGKRQDDKEAK